MNQIIVTEDSNNMSAIELVVFDFDQTLVNCDSDLFIGELAPNSTIPDELYDKVKGDPECIGKMQQVFCYLYDCGVRNLDYNVCIGRMPFVDGMKGLMRNLDQSSTRFEVIVTSDANTYFIGYFLQYHRLEHVVKKVYTNPAHFDSTGCLQISRCHKPQNWCPLSPPNLCKSQVIKEYLAMRAKEGVHFSRVNYVGDGQNDLCPAVKLNNRDRVFPRVGFTLARLLARREIAAQVFPFTSGDDIWKVLIEE